MPSEERSVHLEKNRMAAAKCRRKQKVKMEKLQTTHREQFEENKVLTKLVGDLRGEAQMLRKEVAQRRNSGCLLHGNPELPPVDFTHMMKAEDFMLDNLLPDDFPSSFSEGSEPTSSLFDV